MVALSSLSSGGCGALQLILSLFDTMGKHFEPLGPTGAIVGGAEGPSPYKAGRLPQDKPRIKQNRKCRDIVFLLIFLAFWVGMIVNSSFGFNKGNPRRLIYGVDYKGNLCGDKKASPNLHKFEVRYWLNPNQVYESGIRARPINLVDARSICLRSCPSPTNISLSWVCDYPEGPINLSMRDWARRNYNYYDDLNIEQQASSKKLQGPCYPVLFKSTNLFWSCQFSPSASNASLELWYSMNGTHIEQGDILVKAIHELITAPSIVLKRYIGDIGKAWPVLIVCGGLAPLMLSLLWLLVVRYFVGIMTWATIVVLNLMATLVTVFFYIKAGWIGTDAISAVIGEGASNILLDASSSEKSHLKIVAIVMTVILILIFLMTMVLLKRIVVAIAVLKVAAKAIGAIPTLIIYPIMPYLFLGIFLIYWVGAVLYLLSAGDMKQNTCDGNQCCAYDLLSQAVKCDGCCGYSFHYKKNVEWAILYHIFGCFWTVQFIIACSLTTIAGSVATYYWARGDTEAMPFFTVVSSAKMVARYSLGSMALGSLTVAIIEMIRFILEAIRQKFKALEAVPGGCVLKLCWWPIQCCLGCLEWTVKFINRNAYIVIAISGKGFCQSAGKATGLIVNNILRVGTVNVLANIVIFLGKVSVSFSCALFAFLMLDQSRFKSGHNKVSSPLFPVVLCWGISYAIATLFFSVIEMAIDTVLLSFCIDADENNGAPIYAPPLLMETLSAHGKTQHS